MNDRCAIAVNGLGTASTATFAATAIAYTGGPRFLLDLPPGYDEWRTAMHQVGALT